MKNTFSLLTKIIGIVCAVLMLASLVLQFVPCWEIEDGTMSISEYVWFPYHHNDFTKEYREWTGDDMLSSGDLSGSNPLLLAFGVLGIVFCLIRSKKAWVYLLPIVCGVCVLSQCLPVLSYGAQYLIGTALYMPLLMLGVAQTVLGIAGMVMAIVAKKKN